ncbi:metallophosphoesterase [Candidatus Pacearchaeota archaeon]|nr:metallophosphoesterase [Candidatus Pacearchaeota archaeon]
MKILAIGDFHGKFPRKYLDLIKREKIDLVVSNGDYPTFSLKKEFFEYVYGKEYLDLWNFIGKKNYKKKMSTDFENGKRVIKTLNKLTIPVLTVLGNHDYPNAYDVMDIKRPKGKRFWKWDWKRGFYIKKVLERCKNIKIIDYAYFRFRGFIFIGMSGGSFPGHVKSKAYKKHRKILERLFKRFNEENKQRKVIFVSHNSPYKTKLDLITSREAHKIAKGKHYGSKLIRRIINKYQPVLSLSGHIEEGMGKQKIGKTLAVNVGSVHHGNGTIIEIIGSNIKVRFIK